MAPAPPLFTAVSSSARQILLLLRCISFAKKAQVRISSDGLRFSTEDGSAMEAFVVLEKALFTSYSYHSPPDSEPSVFEISLLSLLEALNIFSLSDPAANRRPGGGGDFDSFAAHRLQRHAGLTLGVTGICSLHYSSLGAPLEIHMSESGVSTTCELTTYDTADSAGDDIPFDRESLALKTIMRSSHLLDAIVELSAMNSAEITMSASPPSRGANGGVLSLSVAGPLGEASVDFSAAELQQDSEMSIVETFQCPARMRTQFRFGVLKAAQRAMAAATKLSLRVDQEGVLSMQFLVEVEAGSGDGVAFVDFRAVPLVDDGEEEGNAYAETDSE